MTRRNLLALLLAVCGLVCVPWANAQHDPHTDKPIKHDVKHAGEDVPPRKITDLRPTVVLISIDGFRWDYLSKYDAPTLKNWAKAGVKADALVPAFPSKTFPNHYTIVTGLYTEDHGIVGNDMWDPEYPKTRFSMSKRDEVQNARWWLGEPIWITAQKSGMKTAPLFWPGSEAEVRGMRPTYWIPYESGKFSVEFRRKQFFEWLDMPVNERPQYISLYYEDVDNAGHYHGPDSKEVREAVSLVDRALADIWKGLKQRGIEKKVNLIVVSDHGMAAVSPERQIFLDELTDISGLEVVNWGEYFGANAKNGDHEAAYQKLKNVTPHMKVYRKADIPDRLHWKHSARIPEIVGLMDEGWTVTYRAYVERRRKEGKAPYRGAHGYDNQFKSMHGLFVALGPAFKSGKQLPEVPNVDIYALMCKLLGLQPAQNDGTVEPFKPVLK